MFLTFPCCYNKPFDGFNGVFLWMLQNILNTIVNKPERKWSDVCAVFDINRSNFLLGCCLNRSVSHFRDNPNTLFICPTDTDGRVILTSLASLAFRQNLQAWRKHWEEKGNGTPVRSVIMSESDQDRCVFRFQNTCDQTGCVFSCVVHCSDAITQTGGRFLDLLSSAVSGWYLHPNWIFNGISEGASTMNNLSFKLTRLGFSHP